MSVIAFCAATPSTCDSEKEVIAWMIVAPPAASAAAHPDRSARPGGAQIGRPLMTRTAQQRVADVEGRLRRGGVVDREHFAVEVRVGHARQQIRTCGPPAQRSGQLHATRHRCAGAL